ncbi:transglutaminase domain-containing protein [Tenacibaculum tangerinum]|uniref:Transglutaminase domain-containing protein n=1 Tax=Tenacibaculum tangerinum TaxID=3038772 RepID=A0ABY8L1S9_9FLAO|nr:transglutaminase domain-containing protein [Tenacibaculum tangerinum]WGH75397.1 transglutaminase domain-containing protein [Tenacibaculum tangerinum]
MKKSLFVIVLFYNLSFSQNLEKNSSLNYHVKVNSTKELTQLINHNFNTDIDKARFLFSWLTSNIRFYSNSNNSTLKDPELIVYYNKDDLKRRRKMINDAIAEKAISSKEGVCIDIAIIFKKVCDLLHIENELIKGYTKMSATDIGIKPKFKNHAWNAVKIDNDWVLIDATYGIKFDSNLLKQVPNFNYFNIAKDKIKLTHYPSDKKWRDFLEQTDLNSFSHLPMVWTPFLESNAKIVSPINGKLNNPKNIFITLKNLESNTDITYKYKQDKHAKNPSVTNSGTYTNIAIDKIKPGVLTLYFNNKSALSYIIAAK